MRLQKKLPQIKKVIKPIFIIGAGRSGSTILGTLLSMHHDIGFLNEPKALWHTIYPFEDLIGSYSRDRAFYRLRAEHVNDDTRRTAHRLYAAFSFLTRSNRVVDKYPELVFRVPFVKEIFQDAKFLFLVRNGWDICYSIKNWSDRKSLKFNGETHGWWGINNRKWSLIINQLIKNDIIYADVLGVVSGLTNFFEMALIEWIVSMREGLAQMNDYPNCINMIKYEDLIYNPRKKLTQIAEFCELKHDEKFFDYAERVIKPPIAHPKLEINPVILPLFKQTMNRLEYQT